MPNVCVEVRIKPGPRNILDFTNNKITVGCKTYTFRRVHNIITQQQFYTSTIHPYVERFLKGENCTILAYGQTGSGKTYTMGLSHHKEKGVIQGAMETVFSTGAVLTCSFIEIYNEEIYDLISDERVPLNIRQGFDDINIVGLRDIEIKSYAEALNVLRIGSINRTTKSTKMNKESSRSHAVFTVTLRTTQEEMTGSKMSFVDLAGSERLKRTECSGKTARESISINAGLLSLGNVISALYLKKPHVPFRDSKLTRILQKCLVGHVLLIACVSGKQEDAFETTNTLKYASRAALISLDQKVSVESDRGRLVVLGLRKEISALKDENNRLRRELIETGWKEDKIRWHPLVVELVQRLTVHEGEEGVKRLLAGEEPSKSMSNEKLISSDATVSGRATGEEPSKSMSNEKLISRDATVSGRTNSNTVKNEKLKGPDENTQNFSTNANEAPPARKKRAKVVSFDMEPKKNILFTPLREIRRLRSTLISTISGYSAISLIFHNEKLHFNSVDSKIRSYDSNVSVVVSDESIRCLCSSENLYYTSRALLKMYTVTGRPLPVHAYKSEISTLKIKNSLIYTGHEDGSLCIVDMRANEAVMTTRIHNSAIFDVLPLQEALYTCSRDHAVKYARAAGEGYKEFVAVSPPHYDSVSSLVAFKGRCISLGRDCSIKVWCDGGPFKTVPYAHDGWIKSGCSGEKFFVTGCKSGVVKFWDFIDGSVRSVGRIELGTGVNCVVFEKDELWVATQNKAIYRYKCDY